MSWIHDCVDTYNMFEMQGYVGKYYAPVTTKNGNIHEIYPLAPIYHSIRLSGICIRIDLYGNFIDSEISDEHIIIPVTAQSDVRSSNIAPHPLFDNFKYCSPSIRPYNHECYKKSLSNFASATNNQYIKAISNYISKGTIDSDCNNTNIGTKSTKKLDDILVRFRVKISDNVNVDVWKDKSVMNAWIDYYESVIESGNAGKCFHMGTCMITGEDCWISTLITRGCTHGSTESLLCDSSNNSMATHCGRFSEYSDCFSIGYKTSFKCMNVLRFLTKNSGIYINGVQMFYSHDFNGTKMIVWSPNGNNVSLDDDFVDGDGTDNDCPVDASDAIDLVYRNKTNFTDADSVVIMQFDRATTGRSNVSYYNNLSYSNFLENVRCFDESIKTTLYGKPYVPKIYEIVDYAYGVEKKDNNRNIMSHANCKSLYNKTCKELLIARLENSPINSSLVQMLANKCSKLPYMSNYNAEKLLTISNALITKYYNN